MKYARIKDKDGNLVKDANGVPYRIEATKFKTKQDALNFLDNIKKAKGLSDIDFCCSHGNCLSTVHFRKETPKVAGTRSRARPQTWVSDNVDDHKPGCPGPTEYDFDHLPHNALKLADAIKKKGEIILFHLNIELGQSSRKSFNKASRSNSADVVWRRKNPTSHSYYDVSDLKTFGKYIAEIITEGGLDALERTKIANEGKIYTLKDFIVRNNAKNRMEILVGDTGRTGLRYKAKLESNRNIKNSFGANIVTGAPRLFLFEAAQTIQQSEHPEGKSTVRGHRHDIGDGRVVYDQLWLDRTNFKADDFFPNGALVLAIPFINTKENSENPIVHWSIRSSDQIDMDPPKALYRILCKNGRNVPDPTPRKPVQLKMKL